MSNNISYEQQTILLLQKLYNQLQDCDSKELFLERLCISVSKKEHIKGLLCKKIFERLESNYQDCAKIIETKNKFGKTDVVIYGAGENGLALYHAWKNDNRLKLIIDRNIDNRPTQNLGIPLILNDDFVENYNGQVVILAVNYYQWRKEVCQYLIQNGIPSEKIFLCPLDYVLQQYFDEDIIKFSENEVFVDCGAFDMDTSMLFAKLAPNYKKIIAFEPEPSNYIHCNETIKNENIRNVELIQAGVGDQNVSLNFLSGNGDCSSITKNKGNTQIEVKRIDDVVKDEYVSFIKMDIEGFELNALHGAQNTIINNKPKLAICLYHLDEDILSIQNYLTTIVPDYKFYIRHYGFNFEQTILYAIV